MSSSAPAHVAAAISADLLEQLQDADRVIDWLALADRAAEHGLVADRLPTGARRLAGAGTLVVGAAGSPALIDIAEAGSPAAALIALIAMLALLVACGLGSWAAIARLTAPEPSAEVPAVTYTAQAELDDDGHLVGRLLRRAPQRGRSGRVAYPERLVAQVALGDERSAQAAERFSELVRWAAELEHSAAQARRVALAGRQAELDARSERAALNVGVAAALNASR